MVLMYKGEIYDLLEPEGVTLSSNGRGKITFANCVQQVTFNREGQDFGFTQEFKRVVGLQTPTISTKSDLLKLMKQARKAKLALASRLKVDVAQLTRASSFAIRIQVPGLQSWVD
jgi:hypothetical protein